MRDAVRDPLTLLPLLLLLLYFAMSLVIDWLRRALTNRQETDR